MINETALTSFHKDLHRTYPLGERFVDELDKWELSPSGVSFSLTNAFERRTAGVKWEQHRITRHWMASGKESSSFLRQHEKQP